MASTVRRGRAAAFRRRARTGRLLLARFAKTDAAKSVERFESGLKEDESLRTSVEEWSEWDELRLAAPALFPVRVDRDTKGCAKKLQKYVDGAGEGAPGLVEARAMLAKFAAE